MSETEREKGIVIVIDAGSIGNTVSAMLQAADAMMVASEKAKETVFELKAFPIESVDIQLIKSNTDGAYRQFEKRDKRKNFR